MKKSLQIILSPISLLIIFSGLIFFIAYISFTLLIFPEIPPAKPTPHELLSLIIAFATFIVYSATLVVISYQVRLDHERRRKQATIEHVEKIKSIYRENDHWLSQMHGDKVDLAKLSSDDVKKIKDMLSVVEHMSAGIMTGVFDFELLDRMSGAFLRRLYYRVEPLIENTRKAKNNANIYSDFQLLVDNINKHRKEGEYSPKNINQAKI